ncbi:MAG: DUF1207 domain-containing protein [Planctomycetaceae bacterium]|nr:DUF1207 domain-containing protein [Planctomycetaceae bacterium]
MWKLPAHKYKSIVQKLSKFYSSCKMSNPIHKKYQTNLFRFFVTIFILFLLVINCVAEELPAKNYADTITNQITPISQNSQNIQNNISFANYDATNNKNLSNSISTLPSLRLDWESEPSEHQILPIDSLKLASASYTVDSNNIFGETTTESRAQLRAWTSQLLPAGRIYQNYLAGVNETRLGLVWNKDRHLGMIWDATVGGNAPLFRYGSNDTIFPEGIQIEVEGSAHLRLDYERERDMDATDFRFALPITFGNKIWQVRTGYFHISSHLGDERMIRLVNEGKPLARINYVRESILLGLSYRPTPSTRLYFEIDYSTWLGELTKPWQFQFGTEYSSPYPLANFSYSPFFAINVQLREERNYDGNLTLQAGLQWRNKTGQLFRIGIQYFRGISEQFEHMYLKRENKFGIGIWYDF